MASDIDADKLAILEEMLIQERERRLGAEPLEIVTGVPSADDEAPPIAKADTAPSVEDFRGRQRVAEALSAVSKPPPSTPGIHVQVAPPTDTDPGAIVEGSYTSQDGVVRVYDMDGKLLGTEHLSPDANAAAVARRVLRAKKGPGDFWKTLH